MDLSGGIGQLKSMDPQELARLVEEMKLSTKKPETVLNLDEKDISIGLERLSRCLMEKVLCPKAINREAFRQQLPLILQAEKSDY